MPYGRLQARVYRGMDINDAVVNVESMTDISSTKPFAHNHSSGVRSVTWDKINEKWMSQFQHENKTIYCGRHETIELAKKAVFDRKELLK